MEQLNSLEANKKLREILDEEIEKLLEAGKTSKESDVEEGIKILDPESGKCILEADEDKYNALNLFQELTDFEKTGTNQLYEFPGMSIGGITTKLILPKGKFQKIAELGKRLEEDLSFIGLKLPSQIYQFTKENFGKNLPGKDFPAPEPKTVEMSNDDYEAYLEEYYKTHGIEKEEDEAAFRRKYPHEKIDYREGLKEKKDFSNEYYTEQVAEHAKGKGETIKAPIAEKLRVFARSIKRPNIFDAEDRVEGTKKWQKVESFVIKTAAIAAGLGVAGILISYNPGFLALGAFAAGFALVRYVQKRRKRKQRLQRELDEEEEKKEAEEAIEEAKEKEKEKEKDKDKGEGKGKDTPEEPGKKPTPGGKDGETPTPEDPGKKPVTKGKDDGKPTPDGPDKKPTPSKKGDATPDGKPDGKPDKTDKKPTPDSPTGTDFTAYGDLDFTTAEEELGMDQAEYVRVNSEIRMLVQEVNALLKDAEVSDKEHLKALQDQLNAKLAQRLQITYKLMSRQEKILDDAGITFRR